MTTAKNFARGKDTTHGLLPGHTHVPPVTAAAQSVSLSILTWHEFRAHCLG
ncbi:MAG: hypothetical protein IJU37_09790 [Desulfovibrio sp.]|nr:hypothetical protein [Desulfovibrio sp.]